MILDVRRSDGPQQEWRALADDLVRSRVDLIIAIGTPAARAALDATTAIPVVFGVRDALGSGLVSSLAKPRANGRRDHLCHGEGVAEPTRRISGEQGTALHTEPRPDHRC